MENYLDIVNGLIVADDARKKQEREAAAALREEIYKEAKTAAGPCLVALQQVLSETSGSPTGPDDYARYASSHMTQHGIVRWDFYIGRDLQVYLDYRYSPIKRLVLSRRGYRETTKELASGTVDDVLPKLLEQLAKHVKYMTDENGYRPKPKKENK